MQQSKILFSLFILIFTSVTSHAQQDDSYEGLWKKVRQYEQDALTRSALETVNLISTKAKDEDNSVQTIKALLYTSKYVLILEEDAQLKIVKDFKSEIAKAQIPSKNVLESYLAQLYWQYFQEHRYQFYNRTQTTSKVDSVDFRTWDLTTLFHEIDRHFQASLENKKELQQTELKSFESVLDTHPGSEYYRPTLFDLLAHEALNFYRTNENGFTRPADQFEIDNPEMLCDAFQFPQIQIETTDKISLQAKALSIYQNLIAFHLSDTNRTAVVDVDIERLDFIHKSAIFPNKDKIYLKVLRNSMQNLDDSPLSALYAYEIARFLHEQGNAYPNKADEENRWKHKEALALCDLAITQFPDSLGADKCKSLKSKILAPTLQITTEKYLPVAADARLLVKYKNLERLQLSAFHISQSELDKLNNLYPEEKQRAFLQQLRVGEKWTAELKNEEDYQQHSIEILVPPLKNGQYVIIANPLHTGAEEDGMNVNQTEKYGTFAFSPVQVTDLALVATTTPKSYRFQVIGRSGGHPVSGAKLNLSYRKNYDGKRLTRTFTTDNKGFVEIPLSDQNWSDVRAIVVHKNEEAHFGPYYVSQRYGDNKGSEMLSSAFLFTDRSIYRPSQPLYFKGILVDKLDGTTKVAANESVVVTLYDANEQEVSKQEYTTNEYGSISGDFILPNNGLTGSYSLNIRSVDGRFQQTHNFSVEEYKRPKFQTTFEPIIQTFRVNDSIKVHGIANSYAGSAITNAKVTYRVQRVVDFPRWYYSHRPYYYNEPQEIAHGQTVTDASGHFEIDFKALPDNSASEENLPIFRYEVSADVTDLNGETRSATTTISVGYHALTATVDLAEQISQDGPSDTLAISTQNLNGQPVAAQGTLKMYKLQAPDKVLRPRPWEAPDYHNWDKIAFKEKFPHDAFANEDDPTTWEKEKLVWETDFSTPSSNDLKESQNKTGNKLNKYNSSGKDYIELPDLNKWTSGKYVVELETKDRFGQTVKEVVQTTLFSEREKQLSDNQLFHIRTDKNSYAKGDDIEVTLSSAADDLFVTLLVEKDRRIIDTRIIALNDNSETFNIPVTADDLGGFAINYHFSAYNSFHSGSLPISVPYPNTNLEIETLAFRDKLKPGTDETWSFKIRGAQGEQVSSELLASMYDTSLDAFAGHMWNFNPLAQPTYYSNIYTDAEQSFGTNTFRTYLDFEPYNFKIQGYTKLEWYGLSFSNAYWARQEYLRRNRKPSRAETTSKDSIEKGKIQGIVMDNEGVVMPGVNIIVKGTIEGTQTDFDGAFSLELAKNKTLEFSYLGYESFSYTMTDDNFIEVYLAEDSSALNEVVTVGYGVESRKAAPARTAEMNMQSDMLETEAAQALEGNAGGVQSAEPKESEAEQVTFEDVPIRENLQETAFFFPQLTIDKEGNVSFNFTTPEALTKWKLQLLAHTKNLKSSIKSMEAVTQKELMVIPNAPRFLREGDEITISTKIANLTEKALFGEAILELTDAVSNKDISSEILVGASKNKTKGNARRKFQVDSLNNTQVSWRLKIPKGFQAIQYKVIAKAGDFSDGEQNWLPVLTNRKLVTETLPMWVRSNQTKTFTLDKLKNTNSKTLSHHQLTLEITSNPAWYAIQALPYLMEYPYDCNEQTFARYYANTLASHIANSNPRIQEVLDQWANAEALISNLEKNQELKSILIQETPWLRDSQSETEQKKRIALLFNTNKMKNEQASALNKLRNNQKTSGAWAWFTGGPDNRFITQHIITGMGHLNHLNVTKSEAESQTGLTATIIRNAIAYLDAEFITEYEEIGKQADNIEENHLSPMQIQYLYMRSFFPERKASPKLEKIISYYREQARKYWKQTGLSSKGMLALVMYRSGDVAMSKKILESLKENSITSDELGMYWKDNIASWHWNEAPIETQALMIEAFGEIYSVDNNRSASQENSDKTIKGTIDNLKIWLLKNKQTNQWNTTKATTEAVYALLLQGSDWLSVTDAVEVRVGGEKMELSKSKSNPEEKTNIEARTGYYKTTWDSNEIDPEMAEVQLAKKGDGIAWGALYWQYFEDLDKIKSAETPLILKKKLFLKKNTNTGEEISEITPKTELKVGDLVRVRIELRSDRDMEFLHMKDLRASGFEPVNVFSAYSWQDGLGYYQSTKDASTNFFFDYLPKGIYVFEYDLRVNNAGNFSNGITTIQSMYAPEFSSHSSGVRVSAVD